MADAGALRDIYRDVNELDRRPEGFRFVATRFDGAPVLVVLVAEDLAARVRNMDRFEAALARASALHHETIASPVQWGRTKDGHLHCAFPSGQRVDLAPGAQSPSDVAILGIQVAHALAAVHAAGLLHGGIVTEALMQTTDRGAQLGRFGLFSALCEGGLGVTDAALGLADAEFVAPEVQAGTMPDERSDVFSLGASLYELLTGKPPYGGRTTSFVMASVLSGQDGASAKSNDAIAGPVIEALLRAIERAPEDRWPSAEAFAQALSLGAMSGEMPAPVRRESWLAAIFRSWFPARRSRAE